MNLKEFNTSLNEISYKIGKFNQLLYELLFIVCIYYLLHKIKQDVLTEFDKIK